MISSDVFRDQPVLTGRRVSLELLGSEHFDAYRSMLAEPEAIRLTGTHQQFTDEEIRQWLAARQDHHDRADWAIVRHEDRVVLGEAVLNELDEHNASANLPGFQAQYPGYEPATIEYARLPVAAYAYRILHDGHGRLRLA